MEAMVVAWIRGCYSLDLDKVELESSGWKNIYTVG